MFTLDAFLIRALLAGIGVALAAAPLGCFVVWRRMAFFGDATAHAAILGVAIALALEVSVTFGALAIALAMAFAVTRLEELGQSSDTSLGVLSHAGLAAGLVAVSLLPGGQIDLMGYLFGDILLVGQREVWMIWAGAAAIAVLFWWRWSSMLTATLNPDLAKAVGIDAGREARILTVALAVVVALSMKVVGVLLIGAMLIIPAAAARPISSSPERMVATAAGLAILSAIGGIAASMALDTPTGPSIVCTAAALFLATHAVRAAKGRAG